MMIDLYEQVSWAGRKPRVERDPATGEIVIRGVKFLGTRSANMNPDGTHNEYPLSTRQKALPLYEGSAVFLNHRAPGSQVERGVHEKLGELREAEAREDGNYGTLRLNPKHPSAEQIAWAAEHRPHQLGLSHDAKGNGRVSGKSRLIEQIARVNSVDVVGAGATTHSLFEERTHAPPVDAAELRSDIDHVRAGIDALREARLATERAGLPVGPKNVDDFMAMLEGRPPALDVDQFLLRRLS
jgi:hypothetical protein